MSETTSTRNVARYLPLMARERAGQTAIVSVARQERGGRLHYVRWTYAELDRESDAYAHGLLEAGVRRGTRVLLMVRAGLPLIGLTFALFKLGAVPIVIDPAMGRRNLLQCIAECAPQHHHAGLARGGAVHAGRWVAQCRGALLARRLQRPFAGMARRAEASLRHHRGGEHRSVRWS